MKKLSLLVVFLLGVLPLVAQDADLRGLKIVVSQLEGDTAIVGKQYAVLIAVDKYQTWLALRNPVEDAKAIKDILSRRYLITDFIELYDDSATKSGIIKLFNKLISDTKPEDSILIFYAGHGYLDKGSNSGFWIPVDGGMDIDEQANWLPNSQIRGFISNMKARHIALIADSCFSGDFLNPTRGITPTITNTYFKNAYSRISRQVLTSGASEAVPDESQFTRQLKLALEGNTSPYLDPLMLYNQIRLGVTQTTPLLGDLRDSGHQQGSSFLLFLRDKAATTAEAASSVQKSKTTFEVATITANVNIVTKANGTLLLDGVEQGAIPVGRVATVKNLEAGSHVLEMSYGNGQSETIPITITSEEPLTITFSEVFLPAETPVKGGPATELRDGDALPKASIKIDGKFDDWNGILPAFTSGTGSPKENNLAIDKVYLAVDAKNLYIKFDIKDMSSSSFFHPNNFNTDHNSVYAISLENGTYIVDLQLAFDAHSNVFHWYTQLGRKIGVKDWDVRDTTSSSYAIKGQSLEMSFALQAIGKNLNFLENAGQVTVAAYTGYSDSNWKNWLTTDSTQTKRLTF